MWRQSIILDDAHSDEAAVTHHQDWDTDPDAALQVELRDAAEMRCRIADRAACIAFLREEDASKPRSKMRTLTELEERQRRDIARLREAEAVVTGSYHPEIEPPPVIEAHDGPLPTISLELVESRGLVH